MGKVMAIYERESDLVGIRWSWLDLCPGLKILEWFLTIVTPSVDTTEHYWRSTSSTSWYHFKRRMFKFRVVPEAAYLLHLAFFSFLIIAGFFNYSPQPLWKVDLLKVSSVIIFFPPSSIISFTHWCWINLPEPHMWSETPVQIFNNSP